MSKFTVFITPLYDGPDCCPIWNSLKGNKNYLFNLMQNKNLEYIVISEDRFLCIPKDSPILKNKIVVISNKYNEKHDGNYTLCKSLDHAIRFIPGEFLVLGGRYLYEEAIKHPLCHEVHVTHLISPYHECSNHGALNNLLNDGNLIDNGSYQLECIGETSEEERTSKWSSVEYKFTTYRLNVNRDELNYLRLIERVLKTGDKRIDRTLVGTYSTFGESLSFDLEYSFPLLTTKHVYWKGVVEELLWFISGSTDTKILSSKGVKIWDANTTREYLDEHGLNNYEAGEAGPVYGFQWRHWGAKYDGLGVDYNSIPEPGIDQLKNIIHKIKTNPNDRRIVMSAWNVTELEKMALPPCHMFCQFYVTPGYTFKDVSGNNVDVKPKLSCNMYMRSVDTFLGLPFNIASYALLTYLIAHVCDMTPKTLKIYMGDTHVYNNTCEQVLKQCSRKPYTFPKLEIDANIKDLFAIESKHITLKDYNHHEKITASMAVSASTTLKESTN